jgi:hypothetical protein
MRALKASLATLLLLAVCTGIALAADPNPAPVAGPETAVFAVPKLMKGTLLKDLAVALAENPGVLAAQADSTQKRFHVTFDRQRTSPDEILKAVTGVSKKAKLVTVAPAMGGMKGPGCGGCPSAKKCAASKSK